MPSVSGAVQWVEAHPIEATVIGLGGVVVLLWLFGAFKGGGGSSADAGTANMAAAYYAAEAQQAVVGGQVQVATIQAARDTALGKLQTDAAVALGTTQATAATAINQQNTSTALAITQSNNAAATQISDTASRAALISDWFHNIVPAEFAHGLPGTSSATFNWQGQLFSIGPGSP